MLDIPRIMSSSTTDQQREQGRSQELPLTKLPTQDRALTTPRQIVGARQHAQILKLRQPSSDIVAKTLLTKKTVTSLKRSPRSQSLDCQDSIHKCNRAHLCLLCETTCARQNIMLGSFHKCSSDG
jgi:hypothetical protein